ncbi:protein of unknown function [Pseudorhizobium banfieldiae]|uniref:Uncharacterized protein n=2 Tax=Pseudorhizobium TaxID=1903858 RepID=L0NDT7_9HYPH|nr:protein of unknown function [Pseudorhizobium banfieldiae]
MLPKPRSGALCVQVQFTTFRDKAVVGARRVPSDRHRAARSVTRHTARMVKDNAAAVLKCRVLTLYVGVDLFHLILGLPPPEKRDKGLT